jgi:hypothetical protein
MLQQVRFDRGWRLPSAEVWTSGLALRIHARERKDERWAGSDAQQWPFRRSSSVTRRNRSSGMGSIASYFGPEIRRRPRRQPSSRPSAAIPPIARLVAPHGAHRSVKRPRHVRLLGEPRLHQEHHRIIELLKSQGMSNRAVAHRLGVSEKAIRKLVGPSMPAESAQLAFAGMTAAAAGAPPAAGVPSAKSTDDDEDGSAPSVKDGAGDPISAAEDDAEPVPMRTRQRHRAMGRRPSPNDKGLKKTEENSSLLRLYQNNSSTALAFARSSESRAAVLVAPPARPESLQLRKRAGEADPIQLRARGLNRYRDSAHFEVGSQLIGQP